MAGRVCLHWWLMLVVFVRIGDLNGYPLEDLVVGLPGQPKVGFRQFSGYIDVDVKAGRSLFYYFVEAEQDPDQKPLTLWLNGANDMHIFMMKWYEKFSALKFRDLFLTGESYAGHYIPKLAVALLDHNAHSTASKFNIKGVAIGNPLLKLDRDTRAEYEFLWSHGMISDEIGLTIIKECDFSDYSLGSPDHNVSSKCYGAITEAKLSVSSNADNYDVIVDVCYPSIVEQELRLRKLATKISLGIDVCINYESWFYLNLPEVQSALHANRTNLPYSWSMCSEVLNYTKTDVKMNMLPLLKRIVQNGVPVWVYSGDQDSVIPLLGSRKMIRELAGDLNLKVTVPYGA